MSPDSSRENTEPPDMDTTVCMDMLALLPPGLEQSGDMIGRYKLMELLGEGGFGTVWRAEQSEPIRREVALKVIKAGMDSREIIARFEAERQALALMDHPNIAAVLDAGTTDSGRPYFAMELVKGVPITDFCDAHQLTIRQRLELFIPVCRAVQHAHQKAILHRDLKPSNILVMQVDGAAMPKVIDFGIAKALGTSPEAALQVSLLKTQAGAVIGTPQYMSPEQAGATQDLDTRSDIYTLGVILFELLTGDTPLTRDSLRKAALDEVLRLVREAEPKRPSSRLTRITKAVTQTCTFRQTEPGKLTRLLRGDLDWITLKALEKERERRYGSAAAFAEDLQRHLNDEPVEAGPPGALYRFRKLVQRNRLAMASAAAMLALLLAGIAVSTWQAVRATRAEIAAKVETLRATKAEAAARAQLAEAARSDRLVSAAHFHNGELSEGFARLSRALYYQPDAPEPAALAVAEMNNLNAEPVPLHILQGPSNFGLNRVQFSPDGKTLLTASFGPTAQLWDATSGKLLFEFKGHRSRVNDARFSPDKTCAVTASEDGTLKVWNVKTGALIHTLAGHAGRVYNVRFSPDGRRVVSASLDKTAKVWDVITGTLLLTLTGHTGEVREARFDPEGRRIITGANDFTARVWDAFSGEALAVLNGHNHNLTSASFSPDGQKALTSSWDGSTRLWDAATGALLMTFRMKDSIVGGTDQRLLVETAEFSPDGRHVLTAAHDFKAHIWDTSTGKILTTLNGHAGLMYSAHYSADGSLVLTSSWDGTARLWSAETGETLVVLRGHNGNLLDAVFSPDCQTVATASWDGTSRIWHVGKGIPDGVLSGHAGIVQDVHFSSDGRRIITGASDNTARIWDAESSGAVLHVLQGHEGWVSPTAFRAGNDRILTGCPGAVRIWDASTGEISHVLSMPGYMMNGASFKPLVDGAVFSQDGTRVAAISRERSARIWDVQSGSLLMTLTDPEHLQPSQNYNCTMQFSPDGRRIATSFANSPAYVWSCEDRKLLFTFGQNGKSVRSVRFSPDGKTIVTAHDDNTLTLWDASSGAALFKLKGGGLLSFSNDGQKLFASTSAGASTLQGWSMQDQRLLAELRGHTQVINTVNFSPDNRSLVTASMDETAIIWDAATGKERATLRGHKDGVMFAEFSPDGGRVVTASRDKTARIWHVLPATAGAPPGWFRDLLHYLAQKRINTDGEFEMLKTDEWIMLRSRLQEIARTSKEDKDPYLRVLRRQMRLR